jgi:hypothetical protein
MPALWDKDVIYVSHKALAGALANWAVRQSPYIVPENLGAAIEQFMAHWKAEDFQLMNSRELYDAIKIAVAECPLIEAWNHPKIGNHEYVFVSRYDAPKPDYDFIDLDALVRNVAHDLTLWAQVDHAQDATHEV